MINKREAQAFIEAVKTLRQNVTDDKAIDAIAAYPHWKSGCEYIANDRIVYNNTLYRVIMTHTSQADWNPEAAASLFAKVLIPDNNTIYAWVQPDSINAYMSGDKVTHKGKTWISNLDGNVWEPGVYGWTEMN